MQAGIAHEGAARRHAMVVIRHTVVTLQTAIEHELRRGREEARRASRATLPAEVAAHEAMLRLHRDDEDRAAAHAAAAALAAAWAARAMAEVLGWEEDRSESLARRLAGTVQDARLARTVATETARAFNDERELAFDDVDEESASGLFKVWSAILDRRTCAFCFGKDGHVVELHQGFGTSIPVHPNCRCILEVIRVPKPGRLKDIPLDYELLKREIRDQLREGRHVAGRHATKFVRDSMGTRRSPLTLTERYRRGVHTH